MCGCGLSLDLLGCLSVSAVTVRLESTRVLLRGLFQSWYVPVREFKTFIFTRYSNVFFFKEKFQSMTAGWTCATTAILLNQIK